MAKDDKPYSWFAIAGVAGVAVILGLIVWDRGQREHERRLAAPPPQIAAPAEPAIDPAIYEWLEKETARRLALEKIESQGEVVDCAAEAMIGGLISVDEALSACRAMLTR